MEIRNELLEATSEITGSKIRDLVIGDRRIFNKRDPAVGVSYLEALHKAQEDRGALVSSGSYRTPPMGRAHKGAAPDLLPHTHFLLMSQRLMWT